MEKVFEITAYANDKHYGRALNEHISLLPNDCWVIVRDLDTMYLTDDARQYVNEAIIDNPDAMLMTCLTNRVNNPAFTMGENMFSCTDIVKHISLAKRIGGRRQYAELTGIVPGYLWVFPKSTWRQYPFDDKPLVVEGDASFDVRWTRQMQGKKILILGLYIFHLYRLHRQHRWDIDHLL